MHGYDMEKKITVKKYNDHYFYKATNVVSEGFRLDLLKSAQEYWFVNKKKSIYEEVFPPEATEEILGYLLNDPLWQLFYKEIRIHIMKYCQIMNIDSNKVKMHSSWMTRIQDINFEGDHTKQQLLTAFKRHSTFGNMHSHKVNHIGMVYYLSNPNPKYGTVTKLGDSKVFNNNGEENSIMIFDPRLEHSALYPTLEETKNHPRITVVLDCIPLGKHS